MRDTPHTAGVVGFHFLFVNVTTLIKSIPACEDKVYCSLCHVKKKKKDRCLRGKPEQSWEHFEILTVSFSSKTVSFSCVNVYRNL